MIYLNYQYFYDNIVIILRRGDKRMGKKIKIARILADKTQEQLSKETGISKDYISMLISAYANIILDITY